MFQSKFLRPQVLVNEKEMGSGELVAILLCRSLYLYCIAKRNFTRNSELCNTWLFYYQILSRCDISAVQEVRDARGSAIRILLRELNRY